MMCGGKGERCAACAASRQSPQQRNAQRRPLHLKRVVRWALSCRFVNMPPQSIHTPGKCPLYFPLQCYEHGIDRLSSWHPA